jgi:hypothetical protein
LFRWLPIITSWKKFWSDDCRSWPREEKINNHGCWGTGPCHYPRKYTTCLYIDSIFTWIVTRPCGWGKHAYRGFLTMIIEESVCFMSCEPIFFCNYSYVVHTEYIYIYFFISWTLRMSDNLPERVQILCHAHIICITVLENRILCCQIFCDLLLKSAFERIFNIMQLILVKIKWKYLIQKFHDIGLSYYFKICYELKNKFKTFLVH